MHGMHVDIDKKQTQIAYNSNEPHWENEHFEFPLRGFLPRKTLYYVDSFNRVFDVLNALPKSVVCC